MSKTSNSTAFIPPTTLKPSTILNMKISTLLPLIATALATPIAELDARQSAPPPNQITIISAMTSGNGCPSGTVSTTFSPDKTLVTFGFDAFQTYIGPGTKPQDHSKNCQIHLSLQCKLPSLFDL